MGTGGTSSPYDDVEERADCVRLKKREEATSLDETGEEERVVVLRRGPFVLVLGADCALRGGGGGGGGKGCRCNCNCGCGCGCGCGGTLASPADGFLMIPACSITGEPAAALGAADMDVLLWMNLDRVCVGEGHADADGDTGVEGDGL